MAAVKDIALADPSRGRKNNLFAEFLTPSQSPPLLHHQIAPHMSVHYGRLEQIEIYIYSIRQVCALQEISGRFGNLWKSHAIPLKRKLRINQYLIMYIIEIKSVTFERQF